MARLGKFKRSAERFLKLVFHRPKAKISRGSIMLVVVLPMIFFMALILRLLPLLDSQPIPRAFDCWFQLKVVEYVTQNGFAAFFNWFDEATWLPFGRDITAGTYVGVPFTTAFVYYVANGLGIAVDIRFVAIVMPAIMGACATIAAFFLGREVSNNTVGLLTALFMAFMPAYMQRTIAGFFDNELIGVFAIVITLYFFIRSLKRDSMPSAIAAGLSMAYLQASWGAADYLVDLFAMYAFLMLVGGRYSRRLLSSYLITIALGLFIGNLVPRNGFSEITSVAFLTPIGVGALLALYEIWLRVAKYRQATATALAPHMRPILLGLIAPIVGVAGYFIYAGNIALKITTLNSNPILTIGGKFLTVINPFFRLDQRIFASVAEHLPSPWSSFYSTLSILILFFPLGMYFMFKRRKDEDWLIVLYGLTAVYFAGSMIRLGLILAPGVALLSAVAINSILSPFAKVVSQKSVFERRRFRVSSSLTSEHAFAAYTFVAILVSVSIFGGVAYASSESNRPEFALSGLSSTAQFTDWQTAMTFIRNVLPGSATIASWWDYGYWINSAGGGRTLVDNSTHNSTQIARVGYALMALNLTESLKTFNFWNVSHVLVYWGHRYSGIGGDDGKWPWMVRIAEDRLGTAVIDDATYLGDNPSTTSVETEYTRDPFFDSTLYKLMLWGEPKTESEMQILSSARQSLDQYLLQEQDSRWVSKIPSTLYGAFNQVFISYAYGLVKMYEIDYTMLHQYENRTSADLRVSKGTLTGAKLDGVLSSGEKAFTSQKVIFGGLFDANVYTRSNGTHIYYGIDMQNYESGNDALGLQIAPLGMTSRPDIRLVNYAGHTYYDGHIAYTGDWTFDTTGANSTEYAYGDKVVEFVLPLDSGDTQDLLMNPGMNYEIRLMFWDNEQSGEPTFASEWTTFWVPVDLH